MGNPRVLRWALVAVVAAVVAAIVLQERFLFLALAVFLWGVTIDAVCRGEACLGRAGARVVARRADKPVLFWTFVTFYLVFAVLTSIAVFHGNGPTKTRISDRRCTPADVPVASSSV